MTPSNDAPVTVRALSDAEARRFLLAHNVGRLAYAYRDRVDIEPIHYVADGDWLYGRTSLGTKLATLAHHPWCAFEVDDVRGTFDWTSVVVKGAFYLIDPELASPEAYQRALALLRDLVPETLTPSDPAPHRTVLFRVHASEITGRESRSGGR
jgi:nitroimidazol reductase NimA-like FMN-containing flavoprotein (pyridoxamine 5'-phosphate oxidase superfamily)